MSRAARSDSLDAPVCDEYLVDLDHVCQVQPDVLPIEKAQQIAELFGLLADPNRLRILSVLTHQELCVCDLAAVVNMGESAVSHQLRVLRSMRLVKYQKRGRMVYYRLADTDISKRYQQVAAHLSDHTP
jgi:DNA-binding transcriptional ArsR family regulator